MRIHLALSRLLWSGAGSFRPRRCLQCSAIRKNYSLARPPASIPEDSYTEDEDSGQFRYGPDGTKITRNNKRWLTKKKRKEKSLKVINYKDIGDSTYNEIAEVCEQGKLGACEGGGGLSM